MLKARALVIAAEWCSGCCCPWCRCTAAFDMPIMAVPSLGCWTWPRPRLLWSSRWSWLVVVTARCKLAVVRSGHGHGCDWGRPCMVGEKLALLQASLPVAKAEVRPPNLVVTHVPGSCRVSIFAWKLPGTARPETFSFFCGHYSTELAPRS